MEKRMHVVTGYLVAVFVLLLDLTFFASTLYLFTFVYLFICLFVKFSVIVSDLYNLTALCSSAQLLDVICKTRCCCF